MKLTKTIKKAIDKEITAMALWLEEDETINWREVVECLYDNQGIELFGDDDDAEVMDYLVAQVTEYNMSR